MNRTVAPRRLRSSAYRCVIIMVLLVTSTGVMSCADLLAYLPPPSTKTPFVLTELPTGAVALPFETLGKDYSGALLTIRQPTLVIVSSQEENQVWEDFFYPDAMGRLQERPENVKYDNYFTLAAFRGYEGCGGPRIEIKQIIRQGDAVQVYAYLPDYPRNLACPLEASSAYHMVKVRKEGEWSGEFKFILHDNDRPVAEVRHFIP